MEFKTHHYAVVDTITDEGEQAKEHSELDLHDDAVTDLCLRLQALVTTHSTSSNQESRIFQRRFTQLRLDLDQIRDSIEGHSPDEDTCLLNQLEERLMDLKIEHREIRSALLSSDIEEDDPLYSELSETGKAIFDHALQIKKLLHSQATAAALATERKGGVRLPKMDVPTFDGDILNWRSFWEQFVISVHNRTDLADAEKLVYLQQAIKDGSAKQAIEGLSHSGEHYPEAVSSLRARYDHPRIIHQTHVKKILNTPPVKDGSGKELRKLHDTLQQHLRALKSMEYDPSGPFLTSVIELKLDQNTLFEWQKHTQETVVVPHYQKILDFINLRARAAETSNPESRKPNVPVNKKTGTKPVTTHATTTDVIKCLVCKSVSHPLYTCTKFKSFDHDQMVSVIKSNNLCMNCFRPGHVAYNCKSVHRCKHCQKPHHTLIHKETGNAAPQSQATGAPITTHTALDLRSNALLMTCIVRVHGHNGSHIEARALLDCASSASFISEKVATGLSLKHTKQNAVISGVAGFTKRSTQQPITSFAISPVSSNHKKFNVTAVIVPRVTCDLPSAPISHNQAWLHLNDLSLADPQYGQPGRIDILLGIEIYVQVMCHGRREGPPGSPLAFQTELGWVLAGNVFNNNDSHARVVTHHASVQSGDDLLRKFWEIEESPATMTPMSTDEHLSVHYFDTQHYFSEDGRFVVPLPIKKEIEPIGESRSTAVRRFLSMERSLNTKGQFQELAEVMSEYFESDHAELVPEADLDKPPNQVFYLPMHTVRKETSTTTKIRAVFDASAKSSTGVSLNDTLLVGPTVHPPLIDVLLRFRSYRVALVADVSRMYRAVRLTDTDRDYHRFVWRESPKDPLKDYRMTRVTFGVSASSFIANMCVKQNAVNHSLTHPHASKVVEESFYVDDALTGANSTEKAIELQRELQDLFSRAGFLLRKWNSSDKEVLQHIPKELQDSMSIVAITDPEMYTKALGIEWSTSADCFRLTTSELSPP